MDDSIAIVKYLGCHECGTGWYWYDSECTDEGSIGPFATAELASEDAADAGYAVRVM